MDIITYYKTIYTMDHSGFYTWVIMMAHNIP